MGGQSCDDFPADDRSRHCRYDDVEFRREVFQCFESVCLGTSRDSGCPLHVVAGCDVSAGTQRHHVARHEKTDRSLADDADARPVYGDVGVLDDDFQQAFHDGGAASQHQRLVPFVFMEGYAELRAVGFQVCIRPAEQDVRRQPHA